MLQETRQQESNPNPNPISKVETGLAVMIIVGLADIGLFIYSVILLSQIPAVLPSNADGYYIAMLKMVQSIAIMQSVCVAVLFLPLFITAIMRTNVFWFFLVIFLSAEGFLNIVAAVYAEILLHETSRNCSLTGRNNTLTCDYLSSEYYSLTVYVLSMAVASVVTFLKAMGACCWVCRAYNRTE